jgi:protein-disulfide isomerase
MTRTVLIATICGWLPLGYAVAQDAPAAAAPEPTLKDIQSELAAVKNEVKALRVEMQQVMTAVKAMQAARPAQPQPRQVDTTVYDINVANAPVLGPKDAPVTIVEFADIQCPFCVREYPKLQEVLKAYPQDVRLVFKHYPLPMHKQAKPAHAAVAMAFKQKGSEGFWQMHDAIIEDTNKDAQAKPAERKALNLLTLRAHAEKLGMDLAEFDRVMADAAEQDKLLAADMAEAGKCKVEGTPTVLINGLKMPSRNMPDYKARIDEILKKGGAKAAEAPPAVPVPAPPAAQ